VFLRRAVWENFAIAIYALWEGSPGVGLLRYPFAWPRFRRGGKGRSSARSAQDRRAPAGRTDRHKRSAAPAGRKGADGNPPGKEKLSADRWISLTSLVVALASAAAAILAAVSARNQVHAADQQNVVSEQQQLADVTDKIVRELFQSTADGLQGSELTLEAQSAERIIAELHGKGVTSIEYYDVGRALSVGEGFTSEAIPYYLKSITALPHDPGTEAQSLTGLGIVYYVQGKPGLGHKYFMRSVAVYANVDMFKGAKYNSVAHSYLVDFQYQIKLGNCGTASADLTRAEKAIAQAGGANPTNQSFLTGDKASFASSPCQGNGASGSSP
jgi:hypothetical protein